MIVCKVYVILRWICLHSRLVSLGGATQQLGTQFLLSLCDPCLDLLCCTLGSGPDLVHIGFV